MESELIIRSLAVLVLSMLALVVLIFEEENMARIVRSVDAATASPLSGTKIKQPWVNPSMYAELPVDRPGRRYIPTEYDIADNERPTLTTSGSEDRDYVPPLDGTDSSHLFCQDNYGMRFVLFDLQLLNVDAVDALASSFTVRTLNLPSLHALYIYIRSYYITPLVLCNPYIISLPWYTLH